MGKFIYTIIAFCLFSTGLFSQARLNIFNNAYVSMGGGTSSNPVYLVIENGNANAVSGSANGYIISESEFNKVKWFIGTNTGAYQLPLGKGASGFLNFSFDITSGGVCPLSPCSWTVSSFYTLNNSVLPSGVTNMLPSETSAIDRFWVINPSGYTTNQTSNIRFYYDASALELGGVTEADLQAQWWSSTLLGWINPPIGTVNTVSHYVDVSGVSVQQGPWTLANKNNPLPIELLSFTALWENQEQTTAQLEWKTATETNNAYFDLERSNDALNFESIGTVQGAGTSSMTNYYQYPDSLKDLSNTQKVIYYRLKQVDFDGKYWYSNIVALSRNNTSSLNNLLVFPNPTSNTLNVRFSSIEEGDGEIIILNSISQITAKKQVSMETGINNYVLNVSDFASGMYTLRIVTKNNITNQKISIN